MGPDQGNGNGAPPPNWGVAFDLGLRLGISVILGVGGGYMGPREERLAEMAERDVAASSGEGAVSFGRDYESLFGQVRTVNLAINALVLIAIFLMVTKPGA